MSLRRLLPHRVRPPPTAPFHRTLGPRFSSSKPPPHAPQPNTSLTRLLLRLPPSLRPYLAPLLHAPTTHITSFLILHELTAIIPLLGLSALFYYTNWLPEAWTEGKYVREGVERFGKWFGKKGWFGFTPATSQSANGRGDIAGVEGGRTDTGGRSVEAVEKGEGKALEEEVEQRWNVSSEGGRILVGVATAYAITKVLLPVRIIASVWATPWFARVVVGRIGWLFGRGKGVNASRAAPVTSNKIP